MSREWIVVWLGRRRRDAWDSLCEEFRTRIQRNHAVRDVVLKPSDLRDNRRRLTVEAESIRGALPEKCRMITLDRRGRTLSSRELADRLRDLEETWPYGVAFVLGSDLGLDPSLLRESFLRWSLSAMTFPHALARLVVYEQLYRVVSLQAGTAYHRDPVSGAQPS